MTGHLLCFLVRQIRHPTSPFFLPEALVLGAEQERLHQGDAQNCSKS